MAERRKSTPITFVATLEDEEYGIERETEDSEREPGSSHARLTFTEWFDETVSEFGVKGFLELAGVLDDLETSPAIRVTGMLVSIYSNTTNGEDWDIEFEVTECKPVDLVDSETA